MKENEPSWRAGSSYEAISSSVVGSSTFRDALVTPTQTVTIRPARSKVTEAQSFP